MPIWFSLLKRPLGRRSRVVHLAVHHLPAWRGVGSWSSLLPHPVVNFEQREKERREGGREGRKGRREEGRIGAPLPLAMIYDLLAKECHTHVRARTSLSLSIYVKYTTT